MRRFSLAILMAVILMVGLTPMLAGAHGDEATAGAADYYVLVDAETPGVSIWQESNSDLGLQTVETCHFADGTDAGAAPCDTEEGEISVPSDSKVL